MIQGNFGSEGQLFFELDLSTADGLNLSIIFGQPESPVEGIAPQCRGLIVSVFSDHNQKLSQLDLSRAIEQAVNAGAHIINISAGQLTDFGEAEGWLDKAVQLCKDNNVLIVAAAGNDGCECLHVPASLPTVLRDYQEINCPKKIIYGHSRNKNNHD